MQRARDGGGTARRVGVVALIAASTLAVPSFVPSAAAEDWDLQLGAITGFPQSGTAPFDANTAQAPLFTPFEGEDADNTNNVVRANDAVTYAWSVTGSNVDADAGTVVTLGNVVLEQTITPNAPLTAADIEIEPLNAAECPGAGSGINYNLPTGPIVITCNTGTYNTGDQNTVTIRVRPGGAAVNGDSFSSEQRVYATEGDGNPTETSFDLGATPQGDTIYVTSRPEWNLTKHGFFGNTNVTAYDPDGAGPLPAEDGVITYAVLQISSDRPFGNEALQNPIVVHDELTFTDNSGANTVYSGRYYPVGCSENESPFPGVVYGYHGGPAGVPGNPDACGPVVRDGGDTSGFTLQFPPVDFNPLTYPTAYPASGSLLTGPFYVASVRVAYFIPRSEIEASPSGDQTAQLFNAIGDFDPDGVSGTTSNFGAGFEPGYCTAAEDGLPVANGGSGECDPNSLTDTSSDNVIGPTSIHYDPPGIGGTPVKDTHRTMSPGMDAVVALLPGETTGKGEDGLAEPGMYWMQRVYHNSTSGYAQRGWLCDVFDNSTAVLADLSNVTSPPAAPGSYAQLGSSYVANPADSVIEYGHVDLSGVDTMVTYDGSTDRWEGDWTDLLAQAHGGCADDAFTTWYADPSLVPGGINEVNVIRVRPVDGTTRNVLPNSYLMLGVGMQARETFYGGPHAGATIPDGTVIADQMNSRFDDDLVNGIDGVSYHAQQFSPSPLVWAYSGERVTVRRASLTVLKRSVQGLDTGYDDVAGDPVLSNAGSNYDVTGAGVAGDFVVWEMSPTITSELGGSSLIENVTLTDVLPAGVTYDPVCTAAITGGTPATSAAADTPTPGATTLTWLLGDHSAADDLGVFRICTSTDDFAENGTSYTNSVNFSADGLDPAIDNHTVTVAQANRTKVQKTVDAPLDLLDDDQVWTTTIRNFSNAITPETPRMLEVFPYIGDSTTLNGGARSPATSYVGTNALTVMPEATFLDGTTTAAGVFWFTADAPATINQDPDANIAGNATNWCTTSDGGTTWTFVAGGGSSADCPATAAAVTGFLYTSDNDLTTSADPVHSGIRITFTLQADANEPGNTYTNRFTGDSPTFPASQYLLSNIVTVTTVGFELGDFVWIDANENGLFDNAEQPVPDGVTIELRRASDDSLVDITTTLNGTYQFTGLRGGDYYVQIPATDFQTGGLLDGWDITPAAPEPGDDNVNDTAGHDGTSPGGVTVDGIVSNTITLSATESAGTLTGDEPLLDNTHGLVADPFLDGFGDFTLDLAVIEPPVDIDMVTQLTLGSVADGYVGPGTAPVVTSPGVIAPGTAIHDVVWIAASETPFSQISVDWTLYGPVVPVSGSCTGVDWTGAPIIATGTFTATDAGQYAVGNAAPTAIGCYSYGYDSDGAAPRVLPFTFAAGDPAETVEVEPIIDVDLVTQLRTGTPLGTGFVGAGAPPVVTSPPAITVGEAIYDSLWVVSSATPFPSVTVTWSLLGPVPAIAGSCDTVDWAGALVLASGSFAATNAGEYAVGAATPSATGCYTYTYDSPGAAPFMPAFALAAGDPAETILVNEAPPETTTTTTPDTTVVPSTTTPPSIAPPPPPVTTPITPMASIEPITVPDAGLPTTGSNISGPLLVAAGALLVGMLMILARRRRMPTSGD